MAIKLYNPNEAAKYLRVTRRSVYTYIKEGYLKAAKVGREWRITEDHLEEFARVGIRNNYTSNGQEG